MVTIHRNPDGDTRTADRDNIPTFKEFHIANEEHISDVRRVMREISAKILTAGITHDFTKLSREREFYEDYVKTLKEDPTMSDAFSFTDGKWYKNHIAAERHHIENDRPIDVNLIDILEEIVDKICAYKARSGGYYPDFDFLNDDWLLKDALGNTIKMIDDMTEVEDAEE